MKRTRYLVDNANNHFTSPQAGPRSSDERGHAAQQVEHSQRGIIDLTQCILSLERSEAVGLPMTWAHIHRPLRDDVVSVSNHVLKQAPLKSAHGQASEALASSLVKRITCLNDEAAKGLLLCWAPSFEPLAVAAMNIAAYKSTTGPQDEPSSEPEAVSPRLRGALHRSEHQGSERALATTVDLADDPRPESVDIRQKKDVHNEYANRAPTSEAPSPCPGSSGDRPHGLERNIEAAEGDRTEVAVRPVNARCILTDFKSRNQRIENTKSKGIRIGVLATIHHQKIAKSREVLLSYNQDVDRFIFQHAILPSPGRSAAILKRVDDCCVAIDRYMSSQVLDDREELAFYACAALLGMATAIVREASWSHGLIDASGWERFKEPQLIDRLFEKFWIQVPSTI